MVNSPIKPTKLAIVGAGAVGSTLAFAVIRKMKLTKVLNRPIAVEYEYWPLIIPIL